MTFPDRKDPQRTSSIDVGDTPGITTGVVSIHVERITAACILDKFQGTTTLNSLLANWEMNDKWQRQNVEFLKLKVQCGKYIGKENYTMMCFVFDLW